MSPGGCRQICFLCRHYHTSRQFLNPFITLVQNCTEIAGTAVSCYILSWLKEDLSLTWRQSKPNLEFLRPSSLAGDKILAAMTISLILTKFNLHDSVLIFRETKWSMISVYLIYTRTPKCPLGLASAIIVFLFTLHILTAKNIVIIQFCLLRMHIGKSKQHWIKWHTLQSKFCTVHNKFFWGHILHTY